MSSSAVAPNNLLRAIDSNGQNVFHQATSSGTVTNWVKVLGFALSLQPGSSGPASTNGISVTLPQDQFGKLSQSFGIGGTLASIAIEGTKTNGGKSTPYVEYVYQSCILSSLQFSSETTDGTAGFICASSKQVNPTKTGPISSTTVGGWDRTSNTPSPKRWAS